MQQDYDNGKYTVIFNERTGALHALYNGEVWEDMSGNNLLYWMLVEHKRALERIAELEKDAARYRWLRRNVCIVGGKFHILNLDPRYIAPDAAVELDAAIDAALAKATGQKGGTHDSRRHPAHGAGN